MRVFWDTNLFIYLLEPQGEATDQTIELLGRMNSRGDVLVTSTFTIGEVCVRPASQSSALAEAYRTRIEVLARVIQPFDSSAAMRYSHLRQDRSIRAPDAIQLACATTAGAELFLTNDMRLSRRVVPGVPLVASLAGSPI